MIQHTGIFSLLSLPTLSGGEVVEAILSYHQDTQVVAGWNMSGCSDIFTILHHAGPVLYHAAQFSGNHNHYYVKGLSTFKRTCSGFKDYGLLILFNEMFNPVARAY